MKTTLTFLLVFGILVLVHEFGHFFFAKRAGILVREFAIGMGPKLFSHQGKDGTTYTIRMLPVGGYVRMAGMGEDETELSPGMPLSLELNEDDQVTRIITSKRMQVPNAIPIELISCDLEDALVIKGYVNGQETEEKTYSVLHDATIVELDGTEVRIAPRDVQMQSAKLWQRILTNFAGPLNNFILGIILFILLTFMQGGVALTDSSQLGTIAADSPAEAAGLKEGDEVLSIDGTKISDWTSLQNLVGAKPGEELTFVVERDGQELTIPVTPKTVESGDQKIGQIGVMASMDTSFLGKVSGGFKQAVSMSLSIFRTLGSLITNFSLNKLGGPVMMFQLSSEAASAGATYVIYLMAMLSMNLGIINLLPIPALDGGKIVLNIIEGVRGKPLSQEKEGILTLIGAGLLVVLMILVTWNDIQRFFF